MHQIPDVLVRFDSSKRGHPAQPNSILYNPEQFAIGVLLHLGRGEIGSARIHPATRVSWCVPVEAMTCGAIGAVDCVSFFDACLEIAWWWGNTVAAAPSNQDAFYSCREKGLEVAGLMKRVELYLSESHDHHGGTGRKNNKDDENKEPHLIDSALEAVQKSSEDRVQPGRARTNLRCRFDIRDVNGVAGFVQGSRNIHLLPGERSRFCLIIQHVVRLRRCVE
jgi:hypothetical protein